MWLSTCMTRSMLWIDRLVLFPLNGKVPTAPWRHLTHSVEIPAGCNTGMATGDVSGVIVIDADSDAAASTFADRYPEALRTHCRKTRRGWHFYFQHPGFPVKNSVSQLAEKIDVRGDGGYVVFEAPGYSIENGAEPLPLPEALRDALKFFAPPVVASAGACAPTPIDVSSERGQIALEEARAYLADAPPAIEGENGSGVLFAVAIALVRTHQLPPDVALQEVMAIYNPRCEPPWSEQEIMHKLMDARDKVDRIPGNIHVSSHREAPSEQSEEKAKRLTMSDLVWVLQHHEEWEGVLRFDVLKRRYRAINPPVRLRMERGSFSDADACQILLWLERQGFTSSMMAVKTAVEAVCETPEAKYNPVVAYLDALPRPESTPLLDQLHEKVLNSPDGPIASQILKKHLVMAIRRSRSMPGLHDTPTYIPYRICIILDGEQSTGKSSFLRQLAGEWYGRIRRDVTDVDEILRLHGCLLVEMEEMSSYSKSDRENIKSFVSEEFDEERAKYAASAERVPRSYVLFGTSNDIRLNDPTGNTRFIPIRVGKMCGEQALVGMRDQIWAEANMLATSEFDCSLTQEEKTFAAQQQDDNVVDDIVEETLTEMLLGVKFLTLREAYRLVVQGKASPVPTKQDETRVRDALRKIGCRAYAAPNQFGHPKRGWVVPDYLASRSLRGATTLWLTDRDAEDVRKTWALS